MSTAHREQLLLAGKDFDIAKQFRSVAEAKLKLRQEATDLYLVTDMPVPLYTSEALSRARREFTELNRICLRHAARLQDVSHRVEGRESDMESAVMLFDIRTPAAGAQSPLSD
jgi:hypothetical protein